jgi:hypothetical protein
MESCLLSFCAFSMEPVMVHCLEYMHCLLNALANARMTEVMHFHTTHILRWPLVFQIARFEKSLCYIWVIL